MKYCVPLYGSDTAVNTHLFVRCVSDWLPVYRQTAAKSSRTAWPQWNSDASIGIFNGTAVCLFRLAHTQKSSLLMN